MKRKVLVICVIISIILLLCFLYLYLQKRQSNEITTYVALYDLDSRVVISDELLKEVKYNSDYLNDDIYVDKEDIIGKYVKVGAFIPKGSLIYKNFLETEEEMNDALHLKHNNDESTYDLFVKDININPGNIKKDMHIDLYLTIRKDYVVSDLLCGNLKIIGLYDNDYHEIKESMNMKKLNCLSVEVTNEMIPYINKALMIGKINVVCSSNPYNEEKPYINIDSNILQYLN